MKISFVIPCYRSERTIASVVSEIITEVAKRPGVDYEVIMVSDHSPDGVYSVIERLCRDDSEHLKGIELARNFGQHAALMAGYAHVSGDVVVSLDDDGQAPLESLYEIVDALKDGVDVAIGAYPEKKHNIFRNFGSRINLWMANWLLDKPKETKLTSFFAMRRFVTDEILRYKGPFPYLGGLIFRVTRSVVNVEVQHRARKSGRSGYTFVKLLGLWLNGFTAFSVKPLRLASFAGMFSALAGFLYGIWTVVNKLVINPGTPMGYSSLMSVILFVGGILMMILGLIGEYVGRIYISLNNSPQYVISKETGK